MKRLLFQILAGVWLYLYWFWGALFWMAVYECLTIFT